jgi:hypothetical protein
VPETPEELHARAAGALRRPPVEDWKTFPFEEVWRENIAVVAEALAEPL